MPSHRAIVDNGQLAPHFGVVIHHFVSHSVVGQRADVALSASLNAQPAVHRAVVDGLGAAAGLAVHIAEILLAARAVIAGAGAHIAHHNAVVDDLLIRAISRIADHLSADDAALRIGHLAIRAFTHDVANQPLIGRLPGHPARVRDGNMAAVRRADGQLPRAGVCIQRHIQPAARRIRVKAQALLKRDILNMKLQRTV